MQDATAGSQHPPIAGYSLQEAAAMLGIGVNTLRRRIAAGQIRAEQVQRPQGHVWRVYIDGRHPTGHPANEPPMQEATQEAPGSLPHPPTALAQAEALASLIQATLTPIIAPLVAEQAALRQTVERQADAIADLREDRGRLTAELEQAAGTVVALSDELERMRAPASSPEASGEPTPAQPSNTALGRLALLWGRLWPVLAVLAAALVLAGVLLFVPR
jgi:hypothetical protein